jgi:2-methylisocitrate lyase-like PEP mutase family enzyme
MTDTSQLADKARAFTALHVPGRPIVLPNAWDASSAWVIQQAGAKAIATSSAACAWSIGRADGGGMSRDEAVGVVRRVVSAVEVPVTADTETGYGDDAALAETIRAVLDAGAIGINLEDSGGDPLYPIDIAAQRVSLARETAEAFGVPLHINARVDVFFESVGEPDELVALTLERAAAYLAAGASSIFVPGVRDLAVIEQLTKGIAAPVNILAGASSPSVAQLAEAGVGRISVGSSLNLAILKTLGATVENLLSTGSFAALGGIPYPEINRYFAER